VNVLGPGAGGFLGRNLVERLVERGDRVRAFARGRYPELEALGAQCVQGDLMDREATVAACRGIDLAFHTAAVTDLWGRWAHFHGINTLGTRHVVEGCRVHGVGRLVFTSSPSVVFDGTDQCGLDESTPYPKRWLCHYAHTKALAEQHVLAASGQDGLVTCSLRPHLIWGPRDRHLIPQLLERARRGRLRQVGDGTNRIDMTYIDNAVDAHLQAADALAPGSAVAGRAYFLSQGEPVNCWAWINAILALAGLPPARRAVSLGAAWRLGAALEATWRFLHLPGEPPMTRFLAAQLGRSHYYDVTRAKEDFGYRPRVSTEEGMRRLGESLCALCGGDGTLATPRA